MYVLGFPMHNFFSQQICTFFFQHTYFKTDCRRARNGKRKTYKQNNKQIKMKVCKELNFQKEYTCYMETFVNGNIQKHPTYVETRL